MLPAADRLPAVHKESPGNYVGGVSSYYSEYYDLLHKTYEIHAKTSNILSKINE